MWGANVFIRDCTANGGLVQADYLRDGIHCQWAQLGDACCEKIVLKFEDFKCDALDGLLALFD